jgi:hypothetical protein
VQLLTCVALHAPSVQGVASAASSDNASCVEKFNVAVGTPGEYQSVFHQAMLGRDVSSFAYLGENCPFP